jgi:peptidoglycan/LPS O-acetylase OafA/YrhL
MRVSNRWPALDGLRAVAVCAVILTHTWVSQFPGGWIGVDVFFVLSGFLITGVLLREDGETGTISLLRFYRRRAVRLLPAVLVMLPIVVVAAYVFRPGLASATLRMAIFTVVYSANWFAASHQPTGLLSHTWSLSVEEQFYLVWPVLLILMLRWRSARLALVLTIVCIVAVVIHRTMAAQAVNPHDAQLFFGAPTRGWIRF